jgi:hypothetical protein
VKDHALNAKMEDYTPMAGGNKYQTKVPSKLPTKNKGKQQLNTLPLNFENSHDGSQQDTTHPN